MAAARRVLRVFACPVWREAPKAEPGSAELTVRGLIDEYQVFVHPVVLGGSKRPFAEGTARLGLELVESRTFDGQAVLLRFRRA